MQMILALNIFANSTQNTLCWLIFFRNVRNSIYVFSTSHATLLYFEVELTQHTKKLSHTVPSKAAFWRVSSVIIACWLYKKIDVCKHVMGLPPEAPLFTCPVSLVSLSLMLLFRESERL